MDAHPEHPQPPADAIAPGDRIKGYDLARALAIFGMAVVHFTLVMAAQHSGTDFLSKIVGLLDGRAAATFVVLAGVGLTLRSRRAAGAAEAEPEQLAAVRSTVRRRGLFLLAAGFVNLLIWPGDILRVYGISLLVAAWFLTAPPWRLWAAAAAFIAGFLLLMAVFDYSKNWDWEAMEYHRLWTPGGAVRNLFYDGFRSVFPWTGLLFFGMWLGRHDLRERAVRGRFMAVAAAVVAAAHLASWALLKWALFGPRPRLDRESAVAVFGTESMPPLPLFLMSAGGSAVLVIAASVWAAERFAGTLVVRALVAAGQMAFTWYVGHIVLGLGGVVSLGLAGKHTVAAGAGAAAAFFFLACAASLFWRRRFRHGPLEWLMRRVAG